MSGTVKKKGNRYQVRYTAGFDPETGKRIQKAKRFDTKREADQFLHEVNYQLNKETYTLDSKETFGEFFERWFHVRYKKSVAETTAETRDYTARKHLIPQFGHMKLNQITTMELDYFYSDKIDEEYAPKTVREMHNLMKQSLDQAVKWGLLQSNPALSATPPKVLKKGMTTWNYEEVDRFLDAARVRGDEAIYTTEIFTGVRRGELLGLVWHNVDLEKQKIHIHQSLAYTKEKGLHLKDVKTKSSNRTISISDIVVDVLKQQKIKLDKMKEQLGNAYQNKDLVFPNSFGGFKNPRNLLREFYGITEKAGLQRMAFHNLRHSHATHLLKEGVNPKVVQERFGHHSSAVTLDIYSQVTQDIQDEAALKVEQGYLRHKNRVNTCEQIGT
jgi:integrase